MFNKFFLFISEVRCYLFYCYFFFISYTLFFLFQSALKKSDLLYTFLTSDQELKDNIQLSDLNPWNVSFLIFL